MCFDTDMCRKLSCSPCFLGPCDEALLRVKSHNFWYDFCGQSNRFLLHCVLRLKLFTSSKASSHGPSKQGVQLSFLYISVLRGHPCKNQTKMKFFMARVKNSNCLKFCTQVDPSKTRKVKYFFSSNMFLFSRKTKFSLSPSRINGSGHNRSKIEHFRSLRISKILRLGKSNQRELFHRLFVFYKM